MRDSTQPPLDAHSQQEQAELDFVHQIMAGDEGYCWEPSAPGSEAYLDWLERRWLATAEAPLELQEESFFATLNAAWDSLESSTTIETTITAVLGDRLPQERLRHLLTTAKRVLASGQPLGEQLVQCIQNLVPELHRDDLFTMARPYATVMRDRHSPTSLDQVRTSVRAAQWDDLVPLERARLGLELSHYILAHLSPQGPSSAEPR